MAGANAEYGFTPGGQLRELSTNLEVEFSEGQGIPNLTSFLLNAGQEGYALPPELAGAERNSIEIEVDLGTYRQLQIFKGKREGEEDIWYIRERQGGGNQVGRRTTNQYQWVKKLEGPWAARSNFGEDPQQILVGKPLRLLGWEIGREFSSGASSLGSQIVTGARVRFRGPVRH